MTMITVKNYYLQYILQFEVFGTSFQFTVGKQSKSKLQKISTRGGTIADKVSQFKSQKYTGNIIGSKHCAMVLNST